MRPTGIPWSGPRYEPEEMDRSASRAASRTASAMTVMNELRRPSVSSILSRWAWTSSTGDRSPDESSPEASEMVRQQRSVDGMD